MCKRKGFTLVELLTVISIISLLMAILLPVASRVRRNAQAGVCQSNLRQWGMVYKMYTDEFDGRLPQDYGEFPWYYPIRSYYSNELNLLICPTAKKAADPYGTNSAQPFGGTFLAWGHFQPAETRPAWDTVGSYGLNKWAYKMGKRKDEENTIVSKGGITPLPPSPLPPMLPPLPEDPNEDKPGLFWITAYAHNSNNIPLVFDSCWLYARFIENASPPPKDADSGIHVFSHANPLCIDRHNGGINMVFMDFTVRKVGLKELWTLKWHGQYNTAGPWTKAGGVLPERWPKWLRNCKDY
jgi:prepilin-type N-terminal cleavage/methylation domain-containing protein/prepilin-type processing-associated H-X9-DG protein